MMEVATVLQMKPEIHGADIQYRDDGEQAFNVKVTGRVYWNLSPGDLVLIGFLNGRDEPIIIDQILTNDHYLIKNTDPDNIHMKHTIKDAEDNTTGEIEVQTDKDGNLILTLKGIKGTLDLNVEGDEGNLDIKVNGKTNLTTTGDATITTEGKAKIMAKDNVIIDGKNVELGNNALKSLANDLPNCFFTGSPHTIKNKNVKV